MDKLQQMIMEKRAEVEDLRSRISVLEAEVAALELADKLRPATKAGATSPAPRIEGRKGGGRRPGDISKAWRGILQGVYEFGEPVDYDTVEMIARDQGQELALSSIRDRVRNLVKTGLMAGDAQSGFKVTENAAERFGFATENSGSAESEEVEAESAHNTSGLFDPSPSPAEAHKKGVTHVASRFESNKP